jgi:hypothetical protein
MQPCSIGEGHLDFEFTCPHIIPMRPVNPYTATYHRSQPSRIIALSDRARLQRVIFSSDTRVPPRPLHRYS